MWTVNLNHLAGGGDPPEWFQKAKMQDRIWLRKCKIAKYHTPLSQYELHYTCGYIRFVTYDAMQEFLRLNKGYKERQDHPKIRELIGYAQTEWDASKLAGETVANGQTESEAVQANDIAGSEVVSTSEDQQGKDAAGPNAEGQTESKVADAESEAAQATNIPGSDEVSTSVDQQGKVAAGPNAEGQTDSKVADAESEAAQATNIPGSDEVSTNGIKEVRCGIKCGRCRVRFKGCTNGSLLNDCKDTNGIKGCTR
jgi:hypothetical protein